MPILNNSQAESICLAGIVQYPEAYWSINASELESTDFLGVEHRAVMKAILEVVEKKNNPDYPMIVEAIGKSEETLEFLTGLFAVPVSVPQAIESAAIVKGLSTARKLQSVGARLISLAEEKRADSDSLMSDAESLIRGVRATLPVPDRSPDPSDILARIQTPKDTASIPIRFSPILQSLTGGLQAGHLWIVGGFSSTGKTLAAVNFIYHALRQRKWVEVFSLEMTQEDYLVRLAAVASGVPSRTIKSRAFIGHDQVEAVRNVENWLPSAPIRIYDTAYRLSDIRSKAIRQKETLGLDLLVVDFLQNVYDTGDEVKDARTATLELQNLAKELDCTVMALSQISNEDAKNRAETGKRSGYYSFKGHGAIRDAADIGVMLTRDRYTNPGLLDFDVVKNRHGEIRNIPMYVDLSTGRMTQADDLTEDDDE